MDLQLGKKNENLPTLTTAMKKNTVSTLLWLDYCKVSAFFSLFFGDKLHEDSSKKRLDEIMDFQLGKK